MQRRSQAFRGKSGPGVPIGYCDSLHFFPKSLLFTTNACPAPSFSFPICKMGAGDQREVHPMILYGPCFGEFYVMNPMASIHVLIKDYSKLFGKFHNWPWIHLALPAPGDTSGTMKDEGHRRKELPPSLIFIFISAPPQSSARLSGR